MKVGEKKIRTRGKILRRDGVLRVAPYGIVEDCHLNRALAKTDAFFLCHGIAVYYACALNNLKKTCFCERFRNFTLFFKIELLVFLVQIASAVGHCKQSCFDFLHLRFSFTNFAAAAASES